MNYDLAYTNLGNTGLSISTKNCTFAAPKKHPIVMSQTDQQFDQVAAICQDIFTKKMKDYGSSWRIMRPQSVTDQIFIKANRIRSIETKGISKVDEGIRSELIAIVNYGIIGLIQLELGFSEVDDLTYERGLELYSKYLHEAKKLMMDKNHDYDEAWRAMRIQSYTDLILMKIYRTKQIEDNQGKTLISEGVDANYFDMINYAVFGLIKLIYEEAS
jgi:hypothetical protein